MGKPDSFLIWKKDDGKWMVTIPLRIFIDLFKMEEKEREAEE